MNLKRGLGALALVTASLAVTSRNTWAQDVKPTCPGEVMPDSVSSFVSDRISAVLEQGGNLKVTLPKAMQEIAGSLKACEDMGVLASSDATAASSSTVTNEQVAQIIANVGPVIAFDDGRVNDAPKSEQPERRTQVIGDGANLRKTLAQYAAIPAPPPPAKSCILPEPQQFASFASLIPNIAVSGTVMTLMSEGPARPVDKNQVSILGTTIENINQQLRACVGGYAPNPNP